MDGATAAAVRAACVGARHRIAPEQVALGAYAGQWVVPAAVRGDANIPAAARALLPQGQPVVLDFATLWPQV
jgi:hypothetical protein